MTSNIWSATAGPVPDAATCNSPAVECEMSGGPVHAIPTTLDRIGRILVPVWVDGAGPYRFILDTGANRSAVSPRLVSELRLVPSGSTAIAVHGLTGEAALPAVTIRSLATGSLTLVENKSVPVLSSRVLVDADGILGIEGLERALIQIDFRNDRVEVSHSGLRFNTRGLFRIPVSLRHRGLLLADAHVGKIRVKAIIDTGAERSMGNLALQDRLAHARDGERDLAVTTVYGATPQLESGETIVAPRIEIGGIRAHNLEVTFADLHVFEIWDLNDRPALLVGMDLLGTAGRLIIDYRRREILIEPGGAITSRR